MNLDWLLHGLPGWGVYSFLALLVGVESIGVPVPGETALMAATIASRLPAADFGPMGIFIACASGAIVGDSIGYWVGREQGNRLLGWITRKFPKHVTPAHLGWARELVGKYGAQTVFGGRFVALLRMLAGPLAGSMGMHYPTFLLANALGGIAWSGGMVALIWYLGAAAETYLKSAAWIILALIVVVAVVASRQINAAMQRNVKRWAESHPDEMAQWKNDLAARGKDVEELA